MFECRALQLSDKELYRAYIEDKPHDTSELSFANLFLWREGWHICFAHTERALLIRGTERGKCTFYFPPILRRRGDPYAEVLAEIRERLAETGDPFLVRCVPQWMRDEIEKECPGKYTFTYDRDNCDYIYAREDLAELAGKKYHGKRNHISRFLKEYSYEYETLGDEHVDECMESYDAWLEKHDTPPEQKEVLFYERKSVLDALHFRKELGLCGGVIRVGGRVEAFTVGESLSPETALIHIEKANTQIPGLFTMINREFVRNAWMDKIYINREEDMGLPGLRRAKESYYPVRLMDKYTMREAQ